MTLSKAVLLALGGYRIATGTTWHVLRTFEKARLNNCSMRLSSVEEAMLMMGVQVDTKEGWTAFAALVAAELPAAAAVEGAPEPEALPGGTIIRQTSSGAWCVPEGDCG
jgi:hypothetical protein